MRTFWYWSRSPRWAFWWLSAAGIYNLVWGGLIIAWPHLLFDLTGAERINYPEIWQCVGMIVGVYGIGYLVAAGDSRRHWPIVLVGLLGKICGPIGFALALSRGTFPPLFGVTILTNDLLWWIPFTLILRDAWRMSPNHDSLDQPDASPSHALQQGCVEPRSRMARMNQIPPSENRGSPIPKSIG